MTTMTAFRLLLGALLLSSCNALSSQMLKSARTPTKTLSSSFQLAAVSQSQVAALDGAEWVSLQTYLMEHDQIPRARFSSVGSMTIVTGTVNEERVVGIQASFSDDEDTVSLDGSTSIFKDSMATIPSKVSEQDAISTLLGALVGVHCVLPRLEHVGGSDDDSFVSGEVVVVGGSDYASFCSEALAALGASVVQVSTGSPSSRGVKTMKPAVGELELGFAAVVGEFDALLDCMNDEAKLAGMRVRENEENIMSELVTSGVVAELRKQHKCNRYVSTLSDSQRIIRDEGVLWGPKKASSHVEDVTKIISSGNTQAVLPPLHFSNTLQTLLDQGITWKQQKQNNLLLRGWNLKDFWELTSWPRDSAGTGDVRYGLPVLEDMDTMISERMVAEPPGFSKSKFQEEEESKARQEYDAENPYVMLVRGVDGLQHDIIAAEKDCLLFLSAPWCRTCRYLSPQFTRMARESKEVTFAKADATGQIGKALGKALEVDAVPAFVLFRQGEVFGSPLSVSRLPSKKLQHAIDCLASGMEWDSNLLDEEE